MPRLRSRGARHKRARPRRHDSYFTCGRTRACAGRQRGGALSAASPVLFNKASCDRKLSPVDLVANSTERLRPEPRAPFCSSTYVSIAVTCPDHCTFKAAGCYVTEGFTARTAERLDLAGRSVTGDVTGYLEAEAIKAAFGGKHGRIPQDGARGGRDLRLHVGGDVYSDRAVRWLAAAAADWAKRGGGTVWAYTRRWSEITRTAWGTINVLASCTTPAEMHAARARGYVPAITVGEFPSRRAFRVGELKVIPCPAETGKTTCVSCRLCLDRDLWAMDAAIGFAVHGRGADALRRRLPMLAKARPRAASRVRAPGAVDGQSGSVSSVGAGTSSEATP
jgi:hypothetical protein